MIGDQQKNSWRIESFWLQTIDHLASLYPFYFEQSPNQFYFSMAAAIESIPTEKRKLDIVGVVEFLSTRLFHLLGDRTLVEGIRRAPWMKRPDGKGGWHNVKLPKHDNKIVPVDEFAAAFKKALRHEALSYLESKNRIGILLSGGMDSRIASGIIRELQLSREFTGDVIALTWGLNGTRDVIYAAEIAKRYGWEWVHLPLGPELLKENIDLVGKMGAEFAPFHLHAIAKVRDFDGLDAVIAASYGDSIGRAEFAGVHLQDLKTIVPRNLNRFGLLRNCVVDAVKAEVIKDAYGYRQYILRSAEYQYREIEQYIHYLRRLIQVPMTYIAEKIPLFQLFTAPEVFGMVWQLDPSIRDDRIYAAILPTLPGNIKDIPYARTGRPFGVVDGVPDQAPREYHQYGVWLRQDLREYVIGLIDSDEIRNLGIFNNRMIDMLFKLCFGSRTITPSALDVIIAWLAALSVFIKRYNIQAPEILSYKDLRDYWIMVRGSAYAWMYKTLRELFRE